MKSVAVVGAGLNAATLTGQGRQAIEQAEALLGAARLLEAYAGLRKPSYPEYAPEQVARRVRESGYQRFAVLVSGDTGFYSAAEGLCQALTDCQLELVPGVSSLSYFFARLQRPWQHAALLSCHGREANLADAVRRSPLTFVLAGGNMRELAEELVAAGFGGLTAWIGEELGGSGERIASLAVAELLAATVSPLSVLLVENPGHDSRIRSGIPDGEFRQGRLPMTKAEVRAVALAKLGLKPESVCCDIGCGTGSVTVEMALAAYQGRVYALDKNDEAMGLVRDNCRLFHLGNVIPVLGSAPEALAALPLLDAAFIGGSGGRMGGIVAALLGKNPRTRIVANAVTLEGLYAVGEAFRANGLAAETVQLSVARNKTVGGLTMMAAQNPVFMISGGGHD